MKSSRLIQRLNKPTNFVNPFSFGGGYKNGGLSDEAMDLIRGIFSFDYMGAAEFEHGAVPNAMQALYETKEKEAYSFDVGESTVYVLCAKEHKEGVNRVLYQLIDNENEMLVKRALKEATLLSHALNDPERKTCGWLELDNGFFFFTNKEMWEGTCKLFGVEV